MDDRAVMESTHEKTTVDQMLGSPTILNGIDMKGRVELKEAAGDGINLCLADIGRGESLGGNVGPIDLIEVDQLESPDTHGGQLQGELSSDRSDANDRDGSGRQLLCGNKVPLPIVSAGRWNLRIRPCSLLAIPGSTSP